MRLVEFDYKPEFASKMGIEHTQRTGQHRAGGSVRG